MVTCDKIVLASVYLPNSMIKGDQFAASVHEFQTAVVQCFSKGAKSIIGGGDLNYKASGTMRNYSGNNCFSQASTSSANSDRDACVRGRMARIGCRLTSTSQNRSSCLATKGWGRNARKAQLDYVFASHKFNGESETISKNRFMNSDHYPTKSVLQLYECAFSYEVKTKRRGGVETEWIDSRSGWVWCDMPDLRAGCNEPCQNDRFC